MDPLTFELMVFYYHNATGPSEVKYTKELMAETIRTYAKYNIKINIWPPNLGPLPQTTFGAIASDCFLFGHEPYMWVNALEIINPVIDRFKYALVQKLAIVFGRFDQAGVSGVTHPDGDSRYKTCLPHYIFINTNTKGSYKDNQRSVLAHEVGHACCLVHREGEKKNLMYPEGSQRDADPILDDNQLWLVRASWFGH
jgi:hypothetical protein